VWMRKGLSMSWEAWGTNEPPRLVDCYRCDGSGVDCDNGRKCQLCNGDGEVIEEPEYFDDDVI
jgi:DnaJ-class molecular chaperone